MKVFLISALVVAMAVCALSKTKEGEITPLVRFIGSVNGTMYFAESSELRTWEGAKSHCEAAGMELAKVETYPQSLMLYYQYNATTFDGEFWVAGRDARKPQQFLWDDGSKPEEYFDQLMYFKPEFKIQTCVYWKGLISHNILGADLCTAVKQTLCSIDTHAK